MGSRMKLNLILLLVMAVLLTVVFLEPGLEQETEVKLSDLEPQQVNAFRLERPDSDDVVFNRQNGEWYLQQPINIAANPFRVRQVLEWLSSVSLQQYPAAELSKYGLDKPRVKLHVANMEIAFGQRDPLNHRRYVLLGDTIHMVNDGDMSALLAEWTQFVSSALLPAQAKISILNIPVLGEIKWGDGGWSYSGVLPPPSADSMQSLIDVWTSAKALKVELLVEPSSAAGETVNLHFADGETRAFRIIQQEDTLVLVRPEVELEYHFSSAQAKRMLTWGQPDQVVQ